VDNGKIFTKSSLDNFIAGDGNTSALKLSKASLVDEFAYTLEVGVSPGHMRFADTQHVQCSLKIHKRKLDY
jgi:hypothetical protein